MRKLRRCNRCGLRWQQGKGGLCATCQRHLGLDNRSLHQARELQPSIEILARAERTRIVNGQEFIVMWDGT